MFQAGNLDPASHETQTYISLYISFCTIASDSFLICYFSSQPTISKPRTMSLKGKVYALTGGASGIGFATAKVLAQRGATVSIADIDPDAMSTATAYFEEQGIEALVSRVDVSQRPQVEDWLDATVEKYGRLDGAANVAGIIGKHHGLRAVAELEDEEWHKIIAVNLTGTMYCLRAQLNRIVDGGSIVNVASIHGIKGRLQTAHSGSLKLTSIIRICQARRL